MKPKKERLGFGHQYSLQSNIIYQHDKDANIHKYQSTKKKQKRQCILFWMLIGTGNLHQISQKAAMKMTNSPSATQARVDIKLDIIITDKIYL